MQGWTTTASNKFTGKRTTKGLKHAGNLFRKNLIAFVLFTVKQRLEYNHIILLDCC